MAHHCFFHEHPKVNKEILIAGVDTFFESIKKEFWNTIFDEICIMQKLAKNVHYSLISGHSVEPKRRATDCSEEKVIEEIEKELSETLKRWILADHEGFFDMRKNASGVFDAITRINDTYICFNNTTSCISNIESEYGISRNRMLTHIRNFVKIFE